MSMWTVKAHDLIPAQAKIIAELARESSDTTLLRPIIGATPAGDEARLRGIPVIGARGVGGTIRGTRPGSGHLFDTDGHRTDNWA